MNTCAWCNTSVADDKTIWIRKNLLIGYPFCSNKCSAQWKNNKVNASSNNAKSIEEVVEHDAFGARGGDEFGRTDLGNLPNSQVVFVQATKTVEQILAEAEMAKIKHQIEQKKQAAVDKSNKEFFDNLKKNWKAIVVVAIVATIGIGVFSHFKDISKQNDAKLSQKLEQIEDKVKLSIQSGDKEKALELANQLVHPSHENMETQKFDAWSGYPKYDEYWSKKREEYKERIMN